MVSGSSSTLAVVEEAADWRVLVVGALGRDERGRSISFSESELAEEESLSKPARRAAVWVGVRAGSSEASSGSSGAGSGTETLGLVGFLECFFVVVAFCVGALEVVEVLGALRADFSGAGLSADLAILAFLDVAVMLSALLRFFALVVVDIFGGESVKRNRGASSNFFLKLGGFCRRCSGALTSSASRS